MMATTDKPYGDVEYADPEEGKYPIDTEEHCRAALAYVNMPKNAAVLGDKLAAVKARIVAAAKKFGIDVADHAAARSVPLEDDTIERRAVLMPVELRALPDGAEGSRTIVGVAAVFNSDSRMIPRVMGSSFIESIVPTFFEEARAAGWPGNQGSGVLCRFNHNDQYLLGTTAAGTCELTIDRTGLEYRIPNVPRCRDDVLEGVGRGDIRQSSFTFMDAEDDWSYSGGVTHRTLISGGVLDVAPVSAVAGYQNTTVSLRSLAASKDVPVDDVYALAKRHELRQLFVRTDIAPPTPPPADVPEDVAADVPAEVSSDAGTQLELNVESGIPLATALARLRVLELARP
jgi:phage head maturation protease